MLTFVKFDDLWDGAYTVAEIKSIFYHSRSAKMLRGIRVMLTQNGQTVWTLLPNYLEHRFTDLEIEELAQHEIELKKINGKAEWIVKPHQDEYWKQEVKEHCDGWY